jgi:hypothetical protein
MEFDEAGIPVYDEALLDRLRTLKEDTRRFLITVDAAIDKTKAGDGDLYRSQYNAAVKRASLDLTRVLARYRQNRFSPE